MAQRIDDLSTYALILSICSLPLSFVWRLASPDIDRPASQTWSDSTAHGASSPRASRQVSDRARRPLEVSLVVWRIVCHGLAALSSHGLRLGFLVV